MKSDDDTNPLLKPGAFITDNKRLFEVRRIIENKKHGDGVVVRKLEIQDSAGEEKIYEYRLNLIMENFELVREAPEVPSPDAFLEVAA